MKAKSQSPKLGGWATVAARGKTRPPQQAITQRRAPPPGIQQKRNYPPNENYHQRPKSARFPSRDQNRPPYPNQRDDSYMKYRQQNKSDMQPDWEQERRYPRYNNEDQGMQGYGRGFNKYASGDQLDEGIRKSRPMRSDGVSWWRKNGDTVKQPPMDTRTKEPNMKDEPCDRSASPPMNLNNKVYFTLPKQKKLRGLNVLFPPRIPKKTLRGELSFHIRSKIYRNFVKVRFPHSEKYAPGDPEMLEMDCQARRLLRQKDFEPKKMSLPRSAEVERERENYRSSTNEKDSREKEMVRGYEDDLTEEELRQMYEEEMYLKAYEEETMMREMYERELYERELYEAELLAQARTPAEREAIERDIYIRNREIYEAEMYERALWGRQMYREMGDYGADYGAEYSAADYAAHYGAEYGTRAEYERKEYGTRAEYGTREDFDYDAYGGRY